MKLVTAAQRRPLEAESLSDMADFRNISQVSLRVRNLCESVSFYRKVLGMKLGETSTGSLRQRRLSFGASDDIVRGIMLCEGWPLRGASGMDHFTLEADSAEIVMAIYKRAISRDARATTPRTIDDRLQVFVFDPDGHKIEIVAPEGDSSRPKQSRATSRETEEIPGE